MKKILVFLIVVVIVLGSVTTISDGLFDDSKGKLDALSLPNGLTNKEIFDSSSGGSRLQAFPSDNSLQLGFGVSMNTDVKSSNLKEISDDPIYQDGNTEVLEVVDIDGEKYCVSVQFVSTGPQDSASIAKKVDTAKSYLKEFNTLNKAKPVKIA